jgi:hypothetical protein
MKKCVLIASYNNVPKSKTEKQNIKDCNGRNVILELLLVFFFGLPSLLESLIDSIKLEKSNSMI